MVKKNSEFLKEEIVAKLSAFEDESILQIISMLLSSGESAEIEDVPPVHLKQLETALKESKAPENLISVDEFWNEFQEWKRGQNF